MIIHSLNILIILLCLPAGILYADSDQQYRSEYIGQETREIKTLSNQDIVEPWGRILGLKVYPFSSF